MTTPQVAEIATSFRAQREAVLARQGDCCAGCGVRQYSTVVYWKDGPEVVDPALSTKMRERRYGEKPFVYITLTLIDPYGLHSWDCSPGGDGLACGCATDELVALCGRCMEKRG